MDSNHHRRSQPARSTAPGAAIVVRLLGSYARCRHAYTAAARHVARKPSSGAVHQLRSGARRLRAFLRLLSAIVPDRELHAACRQLTHQIKSLAKLRDAHVELGALAVLDTHFDHLPAVIEKFCGKLRKKAHHQGRKALRRARKHASRKVLPAKLPLLAMGRTTATAPDRLVESLLDLCRKAVARQPEAPAGRSLHRGRIALRELRYAAELTGSGATSAIDALHRCQSIMGEIHDAELLTGRLAKFSAGHRRRAQCLARILERLIARREKLARGYLAASRRVYRPRKGAIARIRRTFAAAR
jgi:CHAD domain-containing protein